MMEKAAIRKLFEQKILILDGAMGTELVRRGMPTGVCPEAWCVKNPQVVSWVYRDYVEAGADIIYTATFGGNQFKLAEYGEKDVIGINRELAALAKKIAGKRSLVAGDIAPSGKFVKPFGELEFEEAVQAVKLQVQGLLEGGVDLFVIETMMDIQEARAALIAVKETCNAFTMVTMTFEKDGHTLGGTSPLAALVTLQSLGADALGCNCSAGPREMLPLIEMMKPHATVPLVAKPNAGLPRLVEDKTLFDMGPEEFSAFGQAFVKAGANFMGGCCGTSPEHIKALAEKMKKHKPVAPLRRFLAAVSSARIPLIFGENDPLYLVGERINPTGKKALQEELRKGSFALVQKLAREQRQSGAALLDVNAGMPGIDEAAMLSQMVQVLSIKTECALVLDSSNTQALEKALRVYPGRALLNSISAEAEKLEFFSIAAFYGAMVIILPITESALPMTCEERVPIIKKIIKEAERHGFSKDDLIVDGLVMTISSHPSAAKETLKTIAYCHDVLKCKTIIGLSNVSFGMPARNLINAAFLVQAAQSGLTCAIANPGEQSILEGKLVSDLLSGNDPRAERFLAFFGGRPADVSRKAGTEDEKDPRQGVRRAVIEGSPDEITSLIDRAIALECPPLDLVNQYMIPAITDVGTLFAEKKYFLPQLLASAETMEKGFRHLEPLLRQTAYAGKGKIILATVEGDIHDIGKNIVALLLRNHGYEVIDLGKDVRADRIIETAKESKPDLIGLSALMTTTMEKMKHVIQRARSEKLSVPFLLGGAVVTKEFTASLGAHYAKDGVEAVDLVRKLISSP